MRTPAFSSFCAKSRNDPAPVPSGMKSTAAGAVLGLEVHLVLSGDRPDPNILKDGADYWATFSSFEYYPAIVVWHSRDLVNWTPVGPALSKRPMPLQVGSVETAARGNRREVVTRRTVYDLRRARVLHEILVEPLDQASTTALATRILGQPPGPVLAAALYERTEGVPLFVEELASALALYGRLNPSDSGIELAPGTHLPVPDTLRDAVLLRLDGLADPALRLLHLAAVAGRAFDLALVMELAGMAGAGWSML